MIEQRFTRVYLNDVLRADEDRMPVFRHCFENETLMSFWDDDGNYAFQEWWHDVGSKQFLEWMLKHEEWHNYAMKTIDDWANDGEV